MAHLNEISNSRLSGCQYGIYSSSGSPIISNNVLAENSQAGIYVYSGAPKIRFNTIDQNGNYGIYFRLTGGSAELSNNIVTRNAQGLAGDARSASRGYNNVWRNGNNYGWTAGVAETDISSDPLYLDQYASDYRLLDGSASKVASAEGAEIGAYGSGGTPPDAEILNISLSPTLSGQLTRSERWSGDITLTGNVSVN